MISNLQNWYLNRTADANSEPIDLATAKLHLKQDSTADDALISAMITAARQRCEDYTNRVIGQQTFILTQNSFYDDEHLLWRTLSAQSGFYPWTYPYPKLKLRVCPLVSVDSISYVDPDGSTQTWANTNYVVSKPDNGFGFLYPAFAQIYPTARFQPDAVTINLTAGAAATASMIQGMLMLLGHWYENHENVIHSRFAIALPWAVEALWDTYKVF